MRRAPWRFALLGGLLGVDAAVAQDLPALNREMQACVVQVHVQVASREPLAKGQPDDFLRRFVSPQRQGRPAFQHPRGLGLLWQDGRHVLSLAHLLGDDRPTLLAVESESGRRVVADSLGTDPLSGAWLLRLREPLPNPPCRLGSAKGLQVGQEVLGIGNLTSLQRSLQRGIVAGLGRESAAPGQDLGEPLIQTDFRSARGMAGGPLFDLQGRVIGLHDLMLSQGGQDLAALAKPIDELLQGAEVLKAGRARQASRIGLQMGESRDEADDEQADRRWLGGAPSGVGVGRVEPGGPAARGGLREGDRIVAVNDHRVDNPAELARRVARLPVGQVARFSVRRGEHEALELRVVPEPQQPAP